MPIAIIVLVVVILVVGGAGYFGLQSQKATTSSSSSCAPASQCHSSLVTTDATLFVPYSSGFGQKMTSVAAGINISATVGVKGTETIKTFVINWGDGTNSTAPTPTFLHTYAKPGLYVVSGSAVDTSGVTHTGLGQLFPLNVTQSITNTESGHFPALATSFSNGTTGGIYPWVGPGATVTVNGSYVTSPADTLYSALPPTLSYSAGVTQKSSASGATWASGSYTFSSPGTYFITLRGNVTNGTGNTPFTYTWGIFEASTPTGLGCVSCNVAPVASPHPGQFVTYEVQPGGPETVDPAADYYTVGYEVDINIFQTLVEYNGTDVGPTPNNYLPEVATCVPGSPLCSSLYPGSSSLVVNNEYYTFVISPQAKFYDGVTGKAWNIYPTDVYFSMLRTMSFADLPAAAVYPGWIEAQALVGTGNPSWDSSIHSPYNNTPQNMLNSMLINDTTYCPSSAMGAGQSGCITFIVNGAGLNWPAFLSYLAVPSAGAVAPCSWYSSNGATVPGFMGTTGATQALATDTGCLLPTGATTTSSASFKAWVATQSPTSWDSYQGIAVPNYPSPNPSVQWTAVGSGPYYLQDLNPGVSYALKANPAYVQPTGCAGQPNCQPAPGSYVPSSVAYWESDDTSGVQEYTAGYADFAAIEPAHTSTALKLAADHLIGIADVPTLATWDFGYDTDIDMATLPNYDPYPVDIQYNSLSYAGLRGFLTEAYPYATVQAAYNVISGLSYGFNYGGFIPQYMGTYYPTNISWPDYNVTTGAFSNPSENPSTASTVGSAEWYWHQLTTSGSALYDPQFGPSGYSSSHPLHIPALFDEGDPTHQAVLELWDSYLSTISGGAVVLDIYPVSETIVYSLLLPNGQCPWALWFLTWYPDYAQPFDYWAAYGAPSSTWGSPDSLLLTFSQPADNSASCVGYNDPSSFTALAYWAKQPFIPQDCQGPAYNLSNYWANAANHDTNLPEGQMYWNLVDAVYTLLNLYANTEQVSYVYSYAPWIDPASIGTNIVNGIPSAMFLFWEYTGNGIL